MLFPSVSTGNTTAPGKVVGDGIKVAVAVGLGVAVGSRVNVGGMGEGVKVGGTGVEAGAHPLARTIDNANMRMNKVDFFMALSPLGLILR